MMTNCVICTRPTQPSTGLLEEQLSVIYFLKKMMKYSLLVDSNNFIFSETEEGVCQMLNSLLTEQGNPSDWIWFCDTCIQWVDDSRKIHKEIAQMESKLNLLRSSVESKVMDSFKESTLTGNASNSVFETVRKNILLHKNSIQMDQQQDSSAIQIKLEWTNEDFDVEYPSPVGSIHDAETSMKVEDLVIYPSVFNTDEGETKKKVRGVKKTPKEERTCTICHIVFDRPSLMNRHFNSKHAKAAVANCEDCGKGFIRKDSLKLHIRICPKRKTKENSENIILEEDIPEDFVSTELQLSDNDNNDPKPIEIPSQRRGGRIKSSLKKRTCPLCKRVFDRPSVMNRHLSTAHRNRKKGQFECYICNMKFTRKDYFTEHQKTHSKIKTEVFNDEEFSEGFEPDQQESQYKRRGNRVSYNEFTRNSDDDEVNETIIDNADHSDFEIESDSGSNYSDDGKITKKQRLTSNPSSVPKDKNITTEKTTPKKAGRQKSSLEDRTCELCNLVFSRPSQKLIHLNIKHEKKATHTCEVCQKGFTRKVYLQEHMWVHLSAEEKLKKCSNIRQKRIQNAKPSKSPLESRTCPQCHAVFATPSKMTIHLNVKHLRKVLFTCQICERGFLRKDCYQSHMKTHLTPDERHSLLLGSSHIPTGSENADSETGGENKTSSGLVPIFFPRDSRISSLSERTCPKCGKIFDKPSKMLRHLNCVHEKTEIFICEICGKKFTWKDTLQKHMKYHIHEASVLPNFRCDPCGIDFRHRWSFQRHNIMKHEVGKQNQYTCDHCGKSFNIRSHLLQHLKSKSHGGVGFFKHSSKEENKSQGEPSTSVSQSVVTIPTTNNNSLNSFDLQSGQSSENSISNSPHPYQNQPSILIHPYHNSFIAQLHSGYPNGVGFDLASTDMPQQQSHP